MFVSCAQAAAFGVFLVPARVVGLLILHIVYYGIVRLVTIGMKPEGTATSFYSSSELPSHDSIDLFLVQIFKSRCQSLDGLLLK
jgi:hypothetical protein